MARQIEQSQMEIGQASIASIHINPKSRDDIPRILRGLQYIYLTESVREPIFTLLEQRILPNVDKRVGRPGMDLWKIFVLGVLRLDLNCDYDRLCELANEHQTIRQMLGHSDIFEKFCYELQTIKDNVRLLTPELLEEINQIIVKAGHQLLSKKKEDEPLRGRCDSFVLETHVHFPTDTGLLFDAMRKVIQLNASLCERHSLSDWRQHSFNVKQLKKLLRIIQKKKKCRASDEAKKMKLEAALQQAHRDMINKANYFLEKSRKTLDQLAGLSNLNATDVAQIESIQIFTRHAIRQINQIDRRVLQGEVIPHDEKVFSLFQPHTEWISKGKAGKPVELGVRVGILEDQHGFILHHRVMEKETDDQVAVPMVVGTKAAFPNLSSCSFDKGFHSAGNQKELSELLETVAMKRKGKLSNKAKELQTSEDFKKAANKHAAVESAINALEVHGLGKCFDHGIDGLRRYTALGVLARNIHRIGDILHKKNQKRLARQNKVCGNDQHLLAA